MQPGKASLAHMPPWEEAPSAVVAVAALAPWAAEAEAVASPRWPTTRTDLSPNLSQLLHLSPNLSQLLHLSPNL